MTSVANNHDGPPAQEDVVSKSSTQDHTRRSSSIGDGSASSSRSPKSPLSPIAQDMSPALAHVINQIKSLSSCTPSWSEYYLSPADFEKLQRLERDVLEVYNLRYDYSAGDCTFILRMPNHETHEVFLADSTFEIRTQLKQISKQKDIAPTTAEFARDIIDRRHSTFYYPPPFSTAKRNTERSPDGSYVYHLVCKPSCIIEVANSQTAKELEKLAEDYIWGTNAAVRTVVGFDFDYQAGKRATLSIWRPKLNRKGVLTGIRREVVEIRSKDGKRNQDTNAGLRLSLEDFAYRRPTGTFDGLDQVSIFIPVGELCDMLEVAESQDQMGNGGEGIDDSGPSVERARSNSPTHGYNLRPRN
ncbi:hypothetical protein AYO20_09122 [Fonsecaea nubica]|uniref:Uncharacterized protein n=1 Tax=Fonsecaea nubica TaxID=856822 RepID=A0A178CIE6_9EURO|nr:hypothetical protein AYO20_09122 [Fonsecaea nubica]OAL29738.1 hypothetical protein AYO20_09122 [Fonsecaea nubica]